MNFLTLLKLGWRNIWRSKLRSLVVIFSIIIGVWGGLLILGIMYGLNNQSCLLYTSPSPRDRTRSRMPSSV